MACIYLVQFHRLCHKNADVNCLGCLLVMLQVSKSHILRITPALNLFICMLKAFVIIEQRMVTGHGTGQTVLPIKTQHLLHKLQTLPNVFIDITL